MLQIQEKLEQNKFHVMASSLNVSNIPFFDTFTEVLRKKIDVCFAAIPVTKELSKTANNAIIGNHIYFHTLSYPIYCCFQTHGDDIYGTTNTRIKELAERLEKDN